MNPPTPHRLERWALCIAYALFTVSGGAALVCEVSWSRQIGELLGHTAQTAGTVLTACFVGMAIGYELGGRWCRMARPLRGYVGAEISAAAGTLLVPVLLATIDAGEAAHGSQSVVLHWLWSGLCLAALLPATIAQGVSLPMMAECVARAHRAGSVTRASWIYGLNTLGATGGVILASVWLLPIAGVRMSGYLAALAAAACGGLALVLDRCATSALPAGTANSTRETADETGSSSNCESSRRRFPLLSWLARPGVAAGVSGFVVLAAEVLYVRLFALVLHNSTYSFAVVLVMVLWALAAGTLLSSCLTRWLRPSLLCTLALCLSAILIPVSILVFSRQTGFEYLQASGGLWGYLRACAGLGTVTILPPLVCAGMVLPGAWGEAQSLARSIGAVVGRLTTISTLAAAAGAWCASFVLLPTIGLWPAFGLIAAISGGLGCLRLAANGSTWAGAGLAVIVAVALLGLTHTAMRPPLVRREREELVRRWESAYGWVDVVRDVETGVLDVRQNLHYRHGTTGSEVEREQRQAHVPLLLHPDPREVLLLGLGTGVTASGAILHPGVERVDVVELIPEVVAAARLLKPGNLGVLDDSRVRVHVDDARHHLRADASRYDVIIGDLFVPWESGTGYLYTQEHFRQARERLRPGGIYCQWIALYQLGADDFTMIADTFATAFPHCSLWWGYVSPRRPIVALVGTAEPLDGDRRRIEQRIRQLQEGNQFQDDSIATADRLLDLSIGAWRIANPHRLNTAEHPLIEFSAPASQRDGRLLQQARLERYFDGVLSGIPPIEWSSGTDTALQEAELQRIRRSVQRLVLFGEQDASAESGRPARR